MDTAETIDTPVDAPADVAAPEPTLDDLLAEYDRETAKPNLGSQETEIGQGQEPAAPDQPVDQTLEDLLRSTEDQQRIEQLTADLDGLRAAEYQRVNQEAFDKLCADTQSQCGPNAADDFAKTEYGAIAAYGLEVKGWSRLATGDEMKMAFLYRDLTPEQRLAANKEYSELEALRWKVENSPPDDRKAGALAQINNRQYELSIMIGAPAMLRAAKNAVIERSKRQKVYDEQMTADLNDVAFAVKNASGSVPIKDPPPQFGKMTNAEFSNYLRGLGISSGF